MLLVSIENSFKLLENWTLFALCCFWNAPANGNWCFFFVSSLRYQHFSQYGWSSTKTMLFNMKREPKNRNIIIEHCSRSWRLNFQLKRQFSYKIVFFLNVIAFRIHAVTMHSFVFYIVSVDFFYRITKDKTVKKQIIRK